MTVEWSIPVHAKTADAATALLQSGAHGMLLYGPDGVGLENIAHSLTKKSQAVVLTVSPNEKNTITIEVIRELYVTLKTIDQNGRIVIIEHAECMLEPAQNAFLKLLEEPPAGVRFLLLTHTPETLLPTIRSRVQGVEVVPITRIQSEAFLDSLGVVDATKRAQLLFIAEGLPAELTRLIENEDIFEQRARTVRDARLFISGSAYERLKIAHAYKDSREGALLLLSDSMKQLSATIAKTGDISLVKRLDAFLEVYRAIKQNGAVRIQLAATIMVQ